METTIEQARRLSSGTIAHLTGLRNYDEIDEARQAFVDYIEATSDNSETWIEAWQRYDRWTLEYEFDRIMRSLD